jgi:hypothetical protein
MKISNVLTAALDFSLGVASRKLLRADFFNSDSYALDNHGSKDLSAM